VLVVRIAGFRAGSSFHYNFQSRLIQTGDNRRHECYATLPWIAFVGNPKDHVTSSDLAELHGQQIYSAATSLPGMKYSSSNIEPFCQPARWRMPCPFSHMVGCPHRYAVVVSGRKPQ